MTDEPASPVCYAAEGNDVYMGYAAPTEIVAALNELLEAERAGARATLRRHADIDDAAMASLLKSVHADETRWCAMLAREIKRLGHTPSRRCGAFYGKVLAISDPFDRLAFLNRGQAWVVRKLAALLPRVRDEHLYGELREMLVCHQTNIDLAEQFLQQKRT